MRADHTLHRFAWIQAKDKGSPAPSVFAEKTGPDPLRCWVKIRDLPTKIIFISVLWNGIIEA